MTLLGLIVTFVIVGILLYLINTFIPMDGRVKQLLNIAVLLVLVLWLLQGLGILPFLNRPL